ncbi:MAG: hypothetical protein P1U42_12190 [Phycisphaerales bacterium]|nr:hypothetical protein [Phycisphaerales bacterium]
MNNRLVRTLSPYVLCAASSGLVAAPPVYDTANDTQFLRFHGRGDVLRTATPFNGCTAFPYGLVTDDMGQYFHVRLRVRLAPESEYSIIDDNNIQTSGHTTGRILWTQGTIEYGQYAGFTIGYEHDSENDTGYLYLALGDGGDTSGNEDGRTQIWKAEIQLDDGEFHTIDIGYDDNFDSNGNGLAFCWVDDTALAFTSLVSTGVQDSSVHLNGSWYAGGAIMGNPRSDALSKLSGTWTVWNNVIGTRDVVWPNPNGSSSSDVNSLDTYTSAIGDVAYAAFRWAHPESLLSGANKWDVELKLNGSLVDQAGGLENSNGVSTTSLLSAEAGFDSTFPTWIDSGYTEFTKWFPNPVNQSTIQTNHQQTRQILVYHHGLGDQEIRVEEYNGTTSTKQRISRSIVMCIEPDGEIGHFVGSSDTHEYSLVPSGASYPANGQHTLTLPAGKPGLYRILVKSGTANDVEYPPGSGQFQDHREGFAFSSNQEVMYWGALAPIGRLEGVDGLSGSAFAYIPRDIDSCDFTIASGTSLVERPLDSSGGTQVTNATSDLSNKPGIIEATLGSNWSVDALRLPFALCKNEFGAQHYIKGGVIEEENFTLWSIDEKILRDRIVGILENEAPFGDPNLIIDDFGVVNPGAGINHHIVQNPRQYYSLGSYPRGVDLIHTALQRQVTSVNNCMVGSIHQDSSTSSAQLKFGEITDCANNFDEFAPALLFWAGWKDVNANPYFGKDDMKRRARSAMLAYARHIQGNRLRFQKGSASLTHGYGENSLHHGNAGLGGTADLGIGMHWARVFNVFNQDDWDAFLLASAIQFCNIANEYPTSTRNQDLHHLPFLYEFGRLWENQTGSGDVGTWASNYAHELIANPVWATSDVALEEARGFDGSYSGIQNYMLAAGWIVSGDKFDPNNTGVNGDYNREWDFLRTQLNVQYDFWSHFMASSSDGEQIIFGHDNDSRTTRGTVLEQYGGAKAIGTRASDMASRLALESGTSRAEDLLANVWPYSFGIGDTFADTSVVATRWTNVNQGRSGSARSNLMPLYVGGATDLFDMSGDPIDHGALLPSEVPVSVGVHHEEISQAYHVIHTPCYYAIVSDRVPYRFYYQDSLGRHTVIRDVENHSLTSGGGAHDDGTSLTHYLNGDKPSHSDELGGVGFSLLIDKTTPSGNSPVIVGRNWSPFTSHQVVGFTATGKRRWAEQESRILTWDTNTFGQTQLTVSYNLNDGDQDHQTKGYLIERVYTFKTSTIDIDVTVSYDSDAEPLVRLVENVPFELSSTSIGASERAARLSHLQSEELPWGTNPVWDEWCATNWTENGLQYLEQEIGWLQKDITVPTSSNPTTTLSYSFKPQAACAIQGPLNLETNTFTQVLEFTRAFEQGDASADLNGDGVVDQIDLAIFLSHE